MKEKTAMRMSGLMFLFLLIALFGANTTASGAPVFEEEAVAVADLWYAMEVNSKHTRMDAAKREERLDKIQNRQVLYMVSKDSLLDEPPMERDTLAYIINRNSWPISLLGPK